jgi:hypothetical protein
MGADGKLWPAGFNGHPSLLSITSFRLVLLLHAPPIHHVNAGISRRMQASFIAAASRMQLHTSEEMMKLEDVVCKRLQVATSCGGGGECSCQHHEPTHEINEEMTKTTMTSG